MTRPETQARKPGAAAGLRAIILAGGKGVRLHPFTVNFPKPLVPLGDTPVLEVLMRHLIRFGITDITFALGHLAELIQSYLKHRERLLSGIELRYCVEEEPLGTAGSLAKVSGLQDTFIVLNGDLVTDIDLDQIVSFHREQGAVLTIGAHRRAVTNDFGVLQFDSENRVTGYEEKPDTTFHVSMGIYIYEPQVLEFIRPGVHLDFPDLVLMLINGGEKVCAFEPDCLWLDIGRPDDYARAQQLFAASTIE